MYELSCPWTGLQCLTRAKAVVADGSLGVVGADVTLLAILLWKRWIGLRWSFVLWAKRMEDQAWDATARASLLWRLLFLFRVTSVRATGRDMLWFSGSTPPLISIFFLITWNYLLDSTHSSNNMTHLIFLERSHCASQSVFLWWREKRRKICSFFCGLSLWQNIDVALEPSKTQGSSVWTVLRH